MANVYTDIANGDLATPALFNDRLNALRKGDVHNVRAYGAVGNGTTDDTAAIDAAYAACPEGGVILVPANGIYKYVGNLTVAKYVTIKSDGRSGYLNSNTPRIKFTTGGIVVTNDGYVTIEDIDLVGSSSLARTNVVPLSGTWGQIGIKQPTGAYNVRLRNVQIYNFDTGRLGQGGGLYGTTIDCKFFANVVHVAIDDSGGTFETYTNCDFRNAIRHGIYINDAVMNFNSCLFESNGAVPGDLTGMTDYGQWVRGNSNVTFTNCWFNDVFNCESPAIVRMREFTKEGLFHVIGDGVYADVHNLCTSPNLLSTNIARDWLTLGTATVANHAATVGDKADYTRITATTGTSAGVYFRDFTLAADLEALDIYGAFISVDVQVVNGYQNAGFGFDAFPLVYQYSGRNDGATATQWYDKSLYDFSDGLNHTINYWWAPRIDDSGNYLDITERNISELQFQLLFYSNSFAANNLDVHVKNPRIKLFTQREIGQRTRTIAPAVWSSAAAVTDGSTIAHGLNAAPPAAFVQPTVAGEFASITAISSTSLTVALKKHDGTAGTSQTVYWMAFKS